MTDANGRRILVTGDAVVDHHLYQGERASPMGSTSLGLYHLPEVGGAEGVRKLIVAIADEARRQWNIAAERERQEAPGMATPPPRAATPVEAVSGIGLPDPTKPGGEHHAFALWQRHVRERGRPDRGSVWRMAQPLGYGQEKQRASAQASYRPTREVVSGTFDGLVFDDAGAAFRLEQHAECWHIGKAASASWILLKQSAPVAAGDLWHKLLQHREDGTRLADRTLCLVSVQDLRSGPVRLSRNASWERLLEDLSDSLGGHALRPLIECRHLVVLFEGDAALWIDRQKTGVAEFCFAPADAEGDFAATVDGGSIGAMSAMTAALAYGLCQGGDSDPRLGPWLLAGLRTIRDLLKEGHGDAGEPGQAQPTGFPLERLARVIIGPAKTPFARLTIAWPRPEPAQRQPNKPWMMVEESQRPLNSKGARSLIGLACAVVQYGAGAYRALPHARFGKFVTAERDEIEMLRAIRQQVMAYQAQPAGAKPLSIGVFGPPGAGKSFAVREIARELYREKFDRAWMEFNLSQFADPQDLIGALHQVRDRVLEGLIPVVFWDEFDSSKLKWLRYLLAPMQDGRFQSGQITHAVGRSIFVLAGGTAHRWADFPETRSDLDLRALKAPDFKSRLDAYYDVKGPNPRPRRDGSAAVVLEGGEEVADSADIGFSLRRALLIRAHLGLSDNERAEIDADLLRALLLVPRYCHGARSVEKLVKPLVLQKGAPLRRSALPGEPLLRMHVDPAAFERILAERQDFVDQDANDVMARNIHDAYLAQAAARKFPVSPRWNKEFDALAEPDKDDNREAARRIPEVLALAGLGIERVNSPARATAAEGDALTEHLKHNMDRLAEAEHDGWWRVRLRNGWRYGERRDDDAQVHPCMKPYAELPPDVQKNDRNRVLDFPQRLKEIRYRTVWLGSVGDERLAPPPADDPG